MRVNAEQVEAGQAVYTNSVLSIYDLLVLGISNRFIWQCPTQRLLEFYNQNVTGNHLDVGVGTGYFLAHCRFPSPSPRIALMDLNQNTLEFASKRIAKYQPETYLRNVLEPISIEAPKFDSVGINYLFHCLPGSIESKAVALDHLKGLMKPNGILFGSTLLQGGVSRSWFAQRLMDFYNHKGIFSNQDDNLDGLRRSLNLRFTDISVEVVGCVAIFSGRVKQ